MLKVFLHHLVADVARAPRAISDSPEVAAPVPLPQARVFFLEPPARPALEPLDQVRQRSLGRVLDVHVDVVFADHPLEDAHVLGVADLHEQIPAAHLDVSRQHRVAVLRHPDEVRRQPRQGVPAVPVLSHRGRLLARREVCSN